MKSLEESMEEFSDVFLAESLDLFLKDSCRNLEVIYEGIYGGSLKKIVNKILKKFLEYFQKNSWRNLR